MSFNWLLKPLSPFIFICNQLASENITFPLQASSCSAVSSHPSPVSSPASLNIHLRLSLLLEISTAAASSDAVTMMHLLHSFQKYLHEPPVKIPNSPFNLRDSQRTICKVGDFSLSKVKCKTLISGNARGTIPWMVPELLNGRSDLVSEKVDVFSFGIVMWELLMGQELYADIHYEAIIDGIVKNTLRPIIPESCNTEWRSLMEQCWSTEPSKRLCFTKIANKLCSMTSHWQ